MDVEVSQSLPGVVYSLETKRFSEVELPEVVYSLETIRLSEVEYSL